MKAKVYDQIKTSVEVQPNCVIASSPFAFVSGALKA